MTRMIVLACAVALWAGSASAQVGGALGGFPSYTVNTPGLAAGADLNNNANPGNAKNAPPNSSTGGPCYGVWGGCAGEHVEHHGR